METYIYLEIKVVIMPKVIWKDEYSVGIASIDTQHKKLFDIINNFYDSLSQKKNSEALLDIIQELKNYTIFHFSSEESMLRRNNYSDYNNHKAIHQKFIDQVNEFEEKVKSGKMLLSFSVTGFLETWIKNHINGIDKKYSSEMIAQGAR